MESPHQTDSPGVEVPEDAHLEVEEVLVTCGDQEEATEEGATTILHTSSFCLVIGEIFCPFLINHSF